MVSAGDFKNGITVQMDNGIWQIIEFQHVKPGKGAAFVRTKMKNIVSGGVVEKTFRPTEKCPKAHIDRKSMQYLYAENCSSSGIKHSHIPSEIFFIGSECLFQLLKSPVTETFTAFGAQTLKQ